MQIALEDKRRALPESPGVYLFKDGHGDVLYIGKAANLRKRVNQYFTARDVSSKIKVMRQQIVDVDYVETPSEADALIFEAALIGEYAPKYNTRLKDDKSYPLLRFTHEEYPRICIARTKDLKKAGSKNAQEDTQGTYFGPYTDARLLREALRLIHIIFPIRKCKVLPKKACLYYRIKQCIAPCIHRDNATKQEYVGLIGEIKTFLGSGKKSLIAYLSQRMQEESARLNFEYAAVIKKRIEALEGLRKKKFRVQRGAEVHLVATAELKRALGIKGVLDRIICFDVSNIMGKWAVASKVSFFKELPDKTDYRHFKIRSVKGIDDYEMIREALRRVIIALREKRADKWPDLIMIDGGKGHLGAALRVLREEDFEHIPVVAIAKRFEILFSPNVEPVQFPQGTAALGLVKKIRDEAHRFAVDYHIHLRGREMSRSALDEIQGIGESKKAALLNHFTSAKDIANASIEELVRVPGIGPGLARTIKDVLTKDRT